MGGEMGRLFGPRNWLAAGPPRRKTVGVRSMTLHQSFVPATPDPSMAGIIKLACLAVGGQGGGVLTGWIETVARANGYVCQATSVAGVAQRTGATVYYVEMAPASARPPIFSLAPAAGDVDIMISAELMEAGRSIMRGFVTPDRTVLITSTHRALAVSEKMEPGDGIANGAEVLAAADIAARRVITADFDALAIAKGSVISASLFGALAGSGALPFAREAFEAAIRSGGKGIEGSLRAFAADYLTRVEAVLAKDTPAKGHALTREAAKYIANAMCYDDVIRVADLKTRAHRFDRIRAEMGVKDKHVLQLTEFMHPRAEEIAGMLPAKLGAKVEASPAWMARLDRWFNKGRRLRTDGLRAYLMLYVLGGLKSRRRGTLRHKQERAHMDRWLAVADSYLAQNYDLAVEILKCRRLVKGYSDTHARGLSKFDKVLAGIALIAQRDDAADWARRLREAALKDEEGKALYGALATIRSFA